MRDYMTREIMTKVDEDDNNGVGKDGNHTSTSTFPTLPHNDEEEPKQPHKDDDDKEEEEEDATT